MMDPGMGAAPMPPMGPMGPAGPEMAAPALSPVEAVIAALKLMQGERQAEDDIVLSAVMAATGQAQSGLMGVTEGAPMGLPPAGPVGPEGGAY